MIIIITDFEIVINKDSKVYPMEQVKQGEARCFSYQVEKTLLKTGFAVEYYSEKGEVFRKKLEKAKEDLKRDNYYAAFSNTF